MAVDLTDPTVSPGPGYGWDDNWGRWIWNGDPNATDPQNTAGQPVDPNTGNPLPPTVGAAADTPAATPPPAGGGGGGGNLTAPFTGQWQPPNLQGLPDVPQFPTIDYRQAPAFEAPSWEDVLNDPGYNFRKQQAGDAFQNNRAAMGAINTSNTLKDFIDLNSNFASQEYGNVWNRSKSAYDTNYTTQYGDPNRFMLQRAEDEFAPRMVQYSTQAADIQHRNDMANSNSWQKFLSDYDIFRDQRDSTFNKRLAASQ